MKRGRRASVERDWQRERREEIRAELADHAERRIRSLQAKGMSAAEARAEAMRRLGDLERIEEACMRVVERRHFRHRLRGWFEDGLRDVLLALRGFRRRPGLALGVILTSGLAIGAATAVFSVVNGVLLRPLPYPSSDRLYSVYTRFLPETGYDFPYFSLSGPELVDYGENTRAMTGVAGYTFTNVNLGVEGMEPARVPVIAGSWNLFDVLGVKPVAGRGFAESDGVVGAECVTVLSDGLSRDTFGGDAAVVGGDIRVDGAPCRVIGVMPAGFVFPDSRFRLWVALRLGPGSPNWHRQSHPFSGIARLSPDASPAAAATELDALRSQWSAAYPDHYARGHFLVLRGFREDLVGDTKQALIVLLGAVSAVLLIVCANLAALVLSGAESRRREFAVRSALGVSRGRLLRLVLTESVILGLVGGGLGVGLSAGLLRGMIALYPGTLPALSGVGLDARVLAFATGVSLLAGLLFGLVPAVQTSSVGSAETLRTVSRGLTSGRPAVRARQIFVIAQTALALVLGMSATLLARSYGRLRSIDLGFEPAHVLTFALSAPEASYPDPVQAQAFFQRLEERLASLPGVEAAGSLSDLPLVSTGGRDDFGIVGRPAPLAGEQVPNAGYQSATPGALQALGLRLIRGRWFSIDDRAGTPPVAVVNETTARLYFAGEDPLGRRITWGDAPESQATIVGITADTRAAGVQAPPPPVIFTAAAQAPRPAYDGRTMSVAVRFRGDPLAGAEAVRGAVSALDPTLPVARMRTMGRVVGEAVGQPRFTMTLMSAFAAMALLLGGLGLYGVLAHSVQRRRAEIGIRLTLGAGRREVVGMIVRQGLRLTLSGIAVGVAGAMLTSRLITGLIFGIDARDPVSMIAAVAWLTTVAVIACLIPAWRAARTDPAQALRLE